ncbi:hypothetical protein [Piscibacillus halophilus]|uniref:Uncharacterized protein n=1 Tax=Piscibacillus halophilus TaxID=571933 RepID=A0A1H9B4B3_9BACI|nr:hypothetical protein [Piscibacillus halophilus]SEP83880.1 hypothetical protein SAMN05216362_103129 [Piscibacillus halophilus]
MKVFIKGCFQKIAFQLIHELVDQGFEVFGFDEVDSDDEKFDRYAMVGRNSAFHLENSIEDSSQYEYTYDFTIEDGLCTFKDGEQTVLKIYIDCFDAHEERDQITSEHISKWLASLQQYTSLPDQIHLNGEEVNGVHIIKIE